MPHYWIIEDQGDLLIEYFISIKTFLLVKTIFKKKIGEPLYVIREVVKYENFQAFLFLPIKFKTETIVTEYVFNKITLEIQSKKRFSRPEKR